jgi:hypothetical protein
MGRVKQPARPPPPRMDSVTRASLQALLDLLSRTQWRMVRHELVIPMMDRSEFMRDLKGKPDRARVMLSKIQAWNASNELTAAEHTAKIPRVAVLPEVQAESTALEQLLYTDARDTILDLLDAKDATAFRACSANCKEQVASFDWPSIDMMVDHLDLWRACFPRAVQATLQHPTLELEDKRHLFGVKTLVLHPYAGNQNDLLALCPDLVKLSINLSDLEHFDVFDYIPNIEDLSVRLREGTGFMTAIAKLKKLRSLCIDASNSIVHDLALVHHL